MTDTLLPRAQSPMVDRAGIPTAEWYNFLSQSGVAGLALLEAQIAALAALVAQLQAEEPDLGQIAGNMSVEVAGLLGQAVQLSLRGDVLDPGTTYYYGTNADGTKGWHLLGDTLLEGTGITLTVDPVTGEITVALADLADGGGGSFLKFTRDAQGRASGTSAVTTSDLTPLLSTTYQPLAASLTALSGSLLPQAVNDAAAAIAGVPVGGFYANASAVLQRQT